MESETGPVIIIVVIVVLFQYLTVSRVKNLVLVGL